jgi:hypothetical protein
MMAAANPTPVEKRMKRKLLITVGAGASLEFGLPSVNKVDKLFDAQAMTLYPLVSDPSRTCTGTAGTRFRLIMPGRPSRR